MTMIKQSMGRYLICFITCLALASCGSMKSRHVPGEPVTVFDTDMKKECLWLFEGQVFHVTPTGPATAVVASLEWDDTKKKYLKQSGHIILSAIDGEELAFLNIKMENDDYYTILRIIGTTNEEDFILFTIDSDTIQRHVDQGIITALKKEGDYFFNLDKKELDNYVKKYRDKLFDHDIAGVLERLHCRE